MPSCSKNQCNQRLLALLAPFVLAGSVSAAPVVPGVERLPAAKRAEAAFAGEILIGELACTQCHAGDEGNARIWTKTAPDLSQVGSRVTPQYLTEFLTHTHNTKPGTTMPNIFHSSDPTARDGAVDYLTHFLTSLGGPIAPSVSGGTPELVETGKALFHSVGCVACHGPQDEAAEGNFKPLGNLAKKTTVDQLMAFLKNPHQARPGGRMPSLYLSDDETRALSVYLLREQLENPQSQSAPPATQPGLHVDYFELRRIRRVPNFENLEPLKSDAVETITTSVPFKRRGDNYALRFTGQITVPETAEYQFATVSDDGSLLFINGTKVVDNDGDHGMRPRSGNISLEAGTHSFELGYYNGGGGGDLRVAWRYGDDPGEWAPIPAGVFTRSGGEPMIPLHSIDFAVDASKATIGRRMFQAMRCASCHDLEGTPALSNAKPLADLDLDSRDGCLSTSIRKGLPDYQLTDTQREQIRTALSDRSSFQTALSAHQEVRKTLATFNCYACHERDGIGGPSDAVAATYFQSVGDIDLGEEGKIPPTLNNAGAKLKPAAIESIISSQKLHVRHYMQTRMPNFGIDNVKHFAEHVIAADEAPASDPNPPFGEEEAETGRRLVGVTGLACITCHRIGGQNALAIQGIDLATVYDRINPSWFESFLLRPAAYNKDTRMPQFWPDGESPFPDILDGNTEKQIETIWTYLSLRNSAPPPEGIVLAGDVGMELTPLSAPIVHRTFMEDVGPRAILTGFPEKLSTAFDANVIRLAKVWRGRFFDHSGVESGRTDRFLAPLSEDVLDLPAGPAFARLDSPNAAWPTPEKTSRNIGGRFLGYQLGKDRRPTFRYRLGEVTIQEKPEPRLRPGGATLQRTFTIEGNTADGLYFIAGEADSITDQGGLSYKLGDSATISLQGSPTPRPQIRSVGDVQQLLVPIAADNNTSLTQTIEW